MSLADLVPVLLATRMEAPQQTSWERARALRQQWRDRNRERLRAYKREWMAKRKAA